MDDDGDDYFMQLVYLLPKAVVFLSIILDLQYSILSSFHVNILQFICSVTEVYDVCACVCGCSNV